jgi:hypothetical protein
MAISIQRFSQMFTRCYKWAYLALIMVNAVALFFTGGIAVGLLQIYFVAVAIFAINLYSWWGYRSRISWGLELESLLSCGRMITTIMGATIYLADVVALYSPLGLILWEGILFKVIVDSHRLWYWWSCAVLLALEVTYFCCLRSAWKPNEGADVDWKSRFLPESNTESLP